MLESDRLTAAVVRPGILNSHIIVESDSKGTAFSLRKVRNRNRWGDFFFVEIV